MNTVLIVVSIMCFVLGVALGYLSTRRLRNSGPPHASWLIMLGVLSLAAELLAIWRINGG